MIGSLVSLLVLRDKGVVEGLALLVALVPVPLVHFRLREVEASGQRLNFLVCPVHVVLEFLLEDATLTLVHPLHDALSIWKQLVALV